MEGKTRFSVEKVNDMLRCWQDALVLLTCTLPWAQAMNNGNSKGNKPQKQKGIEEVLEMQPKTNLYVPFVMRDADRHTRARVNGLIES
jgi:hypothetical protein